MSTNANMNVTTVSPSPVFYQLTSGDLVISEQSPREPYRRRTGDEKKGVHWGQRKLLLSEIEFLNLFWNSADVPNPIFLYAGAAPGKHIFILSAMFPCVTFHLYDPAAFAKGLHNGKTIFTYQQLFLDEDAQRWAGRNDVYFISDIRTADYTAMSETENEEAIDRDMQMQRRWYEIIKPRGAMLKFRLPYPDRWPTEGYRYMAGHVLKQIWAPQTSTETRLVPVEDGEGNTQDYEWNIREYEEQLFYHNTVIRERLLFADPVTNQSQPLDPPELQNDFDSMAEVAILRDYLVKVSDPSTQLPIEEMRNQVTKARIVELSRMITNSINAGKRKEHWITLNGLRTGPIKSTSVRAQDKLRQVNGQ